MRKKIEVARKIYRQETIDKMQARIDLLGYKESYSAIIFLNIRLLSSIFLFFMIIYLFEWGYVLAPLFTYLYYVLLPKVWIDRKVSARGSRLDDDAMYFFEVLTLSLESGRSLKNALDITASNIDSELSTEFKHTLEEVRLGKSLNESLEELKRRIPSDTINNIILNISQSNIFGNSIIDTMYNQIDYIRDKKIMASKEKISKIPIQISVVSVLFFVPILLLLILSPVIINLILG